MPASQFVSKVILITGASSGIGAATARHLSAMGHQVILGARRAERIATLALTIKESGGEAGHHVLDVTSFDSMQRFVGATHENYGRIDVLVNNAGVMAAPLVKEARVADWIEMIDVNLKGVLHGIAAVLPAMEPQGDGQIINVGSTSAYTVDPTAAVYAGTKHAVREVTEGLKQESRSVRVTLVSPGVRARPGQSCLTASMMCT